MHVCNRAIQRCAAAAILVVAGAAGLADTGRHTVRPGETASGIARDHGTTVAALAAANGLGNPNLVIAGRVLVIPGAPAAAPATTTHTVERGQTLAAIARRYGTTASALAEANGITNPNRIRIGQQLAVPAPGGGAAPPAAPAAPAIHVVAPGETLAGIAGRYGTTASALASSNGIDNPNLVRIGQELTVPPGSAVAAGTAGYALTGGADGRTGVAGTHLVTAGETLEGIARRYGVSADDLAAANGILPPRTVYRTSRLVLDAPNRLPNDFAACPVPGARYMNDWGFPRSGGRAHEGTDLFAARGTPVRAPAAGMVTTRTGAIGVRQFQLVTGDGTVILGSHMDDFGATGNVAAGDVIGTVGTSGNAAGSSPHLHLEVHPDNGAGMNPYPLVRLACG